MFDGSKGNIMRAGNVSSLVRNDVGIYTMTFIVPMPSEYYVLLGGGKQHSSAARPDTIVSMLKDWALRPSQVQFGVTTAAKIVDVSPVYVAVFC